MRELELVTRFRSLGLRYAHGARDVRGNLGAERELLEIGSFVTGALFHRPFPYARRRRITSLGIRIRSASRRKASTLTCHHVMSISNQLRPWRAENGKAWWLLCHPSPKESKATHQQFVERSVVR